MIAAGHPLPDERSVAATRALLDEAARVGPGDRVLLLLSGGASALVGGPMTGVTLAQVRAATDTLLRGGATIGEINTVRRHLGAALGGRLAAATAGRIDALVISDVVGDDPAAIGSGPVSPDPTTLADALAIARRHGLAEDLARALAAVEETPKPGHPAFARVRYRILASPRTLADEAARAARAHGLAPLPRAALVDGDLELFAAELQTRAATLAPGELYIAVGEPTVRVRGDGQGGRAQHLALATARALAGSDCAFVALGSDGSDGPTAAAGAAVDGTTWSEAEARGLGPADALARFDSHPLLVALGLALVTGATGTNLTDLYLLARAA